MLEGQAVLELNNILHILIDNLRAVGPTEILMQFLSFFDDFLLDANIIFQKNS